MKFIFSISKTKISQFRFSARSNSVAIITADFIIQKGFFTDVVLSKFIGQVGEGCGSKLDVCESLSRQQFCRSQIFTFFGNYQKIEIGNKKNLSTRAQTEN